MQPETCCIQKKKKGDFRKTPVKMVALLTRWEYNPKTLAESIEISGVFLGHFEGKILPSLCQVLQLLFQGQCLDLELRSSLSIAAAHWFESYETNQIQRINYGSGNELNFRQSMRALSSVWFQAMIPLRRLNDKASFTKPAGYWFETLLAVYQQFPV